MTWRQGPSVGAKLVGAIAAMVAAAVVYGVMASSAAAQQGPECRGVAATITGTSASSGVDTCRSVELARSC